LEKWEWRKFFITIKIMRRSKTQSLAEVINDYIREMNFGKKLKEVDILDSWDDIVGKAISSRTSKVFIKDSILYVNLKSSIVRNELMMIKEALREKINERSGEEIIKEIVLR
jgi:predicted nucleic acid-binding Zn ribbon protein